MPIFSRPSGKTFPEIPIHVRTFYSVYKKSVKKSLAHYAMAKKVSSTLRSAVASCTLLADRASPEHSRATVSGESWRQNPERGCPHAVRFASLPGQRPPSRRRRTRRRKRRRWLGTSSLSTGRPVVRMSFSFCQLCTRGPQSFVFVHLACGRCAPD